MDKKTKLKQMAIEFGKRLDAARANTIRLAKASQSHRWGEVVVVGQWDREKAIRWDSYEWHQHCLDILESGGAIEMLDPEATPTAEWIDEIAKEVLKARGGPGLATTRLAIAKQVVAFCTDELEGANADAIFVHGANGANDGAPYMIPNVKLDGHLEVFTRWASGDVLYARALGRDGAVHLLRHHEGEGWYCETLRRYVAMGELSWKIESDERR